MKAASKRQGVGDMREEQADWVGEVDVNAIGLSRDLAPGVQRFDITPVPKPRQTQSDRWKKRACVVRYREFKDQVRDLGIEVSESGCRMIFVLPMPESWSNKKRVAMCGQPHKQKPDTDNMVKAILDAIHEEDSQIHHVEGLKFWGESGAIIIQETDKAVRLEGDRVVWESNVA